MSSRFPLPRTLAASIAISLAAGAVVADKSWGAPVLQVARSSGAAQSSSKQSGPQRYIVRFAEPSLGLYNRSLRTSQAKSLNAIGPIPSHIKANGRRQLDTKSAEAKAYLAALSEHQVQHQHEIQTALGRDVHFLRNFRYALNGAVMELSATEANRVGKLPSVVSIVPDRGRPLADDVSTRFIGANAIWLGGTAADHLPGYTFPTLDSLFGELNSSFGGYKGDGIVIGDIDTGYNSLSPSFQATDGSGYTITNPLGSGTFLGDCNVDGISQGGCNDKVIGVYDEVSVQYYGAPATSVEDTQGHGSHTASTMAGNARTAGFPGFSANISGIAPHANLVIYYACAPAPVECQDSATAGSAEQAIADGVVDVLNFSVGGGDRPWNDPVSQAFLAAEEDGIFVAAAAGNTGTGVPVAVPGTANHLEPWVTTVAATTMPADIAELAVSLTGPGSPPSATQGVALTEGTYDTALGAALPGTTPIVLSPTFENTDLSGTDGCSSYPDGTFNNAIALISRGTCAFAVKVPNAIAAGAIAVVIADNRAEGSFSPTVGPPQVAVPVFSIAQDAGSAVAAYLAANNGSGTASVGYGDARLPAQGDVLADFSLLGPGDFDAIKPDVAAPGVAVLAAVANDGSANGPNLVAFYDGTSMATPHITATGALLLGLHPDWTAMEVKSAIMMTAQTSVTKPDKTTPADPYDVGAGRVQAFNATRAGLVLDESSDNMWAAYPDGGGDPTVLNLASMQSSNCALSCTFTRTLRATQAGTWSTQATGELAGRITVTPASFTLAAGDTVTLKISVDTTALSAGNFHFGSLVLGPQSDYLSVSPAPVLHLPLAVSSPLPQLLLASNLVDIPLNGGTSGSGTLALSNPGVGTMLFKPQVGGSVPFVWVNQPSGNYYGFTSTQYDGLGSGDTDFYVADDFIITGSDPVNLASIVTPGFTSNHSLSQFGPGLGLHWRVYADNGGLPSSDPDSGGTAAWSFDTTAGAAGVDVTGDTISLDLVAAGQATALPAGHYWLIVYPDLPCNDTNGFGCTEAWDWLNSWTGTGSLWADIAPQAGYAWDNSSGNAQYGLGLAMTLTSTATCSVPSWLSLNPSFGAVFPVSTTNVTFAADFSAAATMPPATAYVCLNSSLQDDYGLILQNAALPPVQVNAH